MKEVAFVNCFAFFAPTLRTLRAEYFFGHKERKEAQSSQRYSYRWAAHVLGGYWLPVRGANERKSSQ